MIFFFEGRWGLLDMKQGEVAHLDTDEGLRGTLGVHHGPLLFIIGCGLVALVGRGEGGVEREGRIVVLRKVDILALQAGSQ